MQEIKYVPIENLKSHPNNPRVIKDKQFKILCESLKNNKDYFEVRPILCDKDLVIFAGNMRFRAAKEIGLTEVPVAIMDVSDEREKELMIRDNRNNGMWDFDVLANNFDTEKLLQYGFKKHELQLVPMNPSAKKEGETNKKEKTLLPHCPTCKCTPLSP